MGVAGDERLVVAWVLFAKSGRYVKECCLKRSGEGAVLKVMGAKDFRLEVTGREEITPDFAAGEPHR